MVSTVALDRLAVLAVALASGPIPLLGIDHPATHVLILGVIGTQAWLMARPDTSTGGVVRVLDLGWPGWGPAWMWVATAGVGSAAVKWWLDGVWLDGQGGIAFYDALLREQGIVTASGVRWEVLAASAPVLWLVILVDGVFFSGLIQKRVAARTSLHLGVHLQAALFGLPHTFAGPASDPLYGLFTYLAGLAYGYVYAWAGSHWMPAALLWLHVMTVWLLMLLA